MAENAYKKKNRNGKNGKGSIFKAIEKALKFDFIFSEGLPVRYLPQVIYITFLIVIYIAHVHYADKSVRQLSTLKEEVEDLRAYYSALMKDYKYAIIESEMISRLEGTELVESKDPPYKIVVKKK